MKVLTVVGTRPELIRLSLVFRELAASGVENYLVHTGQNYDPMLSDVFFQELDLPKPDAYLEVKSQTVGEQIGHIVARAEGALLDQRPDALLILGDTNSGLSAIAAARHNIPIFHMEAGNRCFDWRVPEEKNRKLIDHISDWLMPYTPRSREYLLAEGIAPSKILLSGNPITDVLKEFRPRWESSDVLERLELEPDRYLLATSHREETVDVPERLKVICDGLTAISDELELPLVWSVHPRTKARLEKFGQAVGSRVLVCEPFGFFDFVRLEASARCVITDSGTVQEECSLLKTPTVTCRDTTERPETVECGSNILSGVADPSRISQCVRLMLSASRDWISPYEADSGVAERVVKFIVGQAR
jgi:UDP-N-acetylglucosamine 2-epimerase (non-hydrolysing)